MSYSSRSSQPPRRPHAGRRRRRIPLLMKIFALIGFAAVLVILGRTIIVPLLVYLNTLGGSV